jgi:hypothetical protein
MPLMGHTSEVKFTLTASIHSSVTVMGLAATRITSIHSAVTVIAKK